MLIPPHKISKLEKNDFTQNINAHFLAQNTNLSQQKKCLQQQQQPPAANSGENTMNKEQLIAAIKNLGGRFPVFSSDQGFVGLDSASTNICDRLESK